ncbi:SHOCT domain-containing protein [Streptomyces sp. NRRL S-378]|uniref:SHOCT domain-containing protein n=1 Tax=Streptomyces sp. NRRL S-378 TaxID=1463904 RepID=UPI0004C739B4|nr:SHOCT domain-containing protein [Streptomyces sp. NRRL S-378]
MFWYDHGMAGWGWVVMALGMVLLVALAVAGVVLLLRSADRPASSTARPPALPSPKQVLADRFARGEIDEEEYEQRLAALRAHGRQA